MTAKWFVLVGDEEMGPLGPNGLRKWIEKGEITAATMLRSEDGGSPTRADEVEGLFPRKEARPHPFAPPRKVHGPYRSPCALSQAVEILLSVCAIVAAVGVVAGLRPADAEFGTTVAVVGLVVLLVTAVLFVLWLRRAVVNLPHLITARVKYGPGWAIACWLVPLVNLLRPYQVLSEVDRLSAEAVADGDAAVKARRRVLILWWTLTLVSAVLVGWALIGTVTSLAVVGCLFVIAAVVPAILLVRGITHGQEVARSRHGGPVQLHHELGRKRGSRVKSSTA